MKKQEELTQKLSKYSATQLISKMEKGVENEEEKNVIISILRKRGKDVTPYKEKTSEEISKEAALDKKQEKFKPNQKVEKEKTKAHSDKKSNKRVQFEDETFKVGSIVKFNEESRKGDFEVKATFYKEKKPEVKFANLKDVETGKSVPKINFDQISVK